MVRLLVKRGEEVQFLYDTPVTGKTTEVIEDIVRIYNGRLKVGRICGEMEELCKHGVALPPNIVGLTDEQVEELKLVDEWGEICIPSGGYEEEKDPIGRRNGKKPKSNMEQVLMKTIEEAKSAISNKLPEAGVAMTWEKVKEQLDLLRGACTIVYPMNLPPHDPIREEFENKEELDGTHDSLQVISPGEAEVWFCGKLITPGKCLMDFIGKNDKTKVVVKIQKKGGGPPGREPVMTEDERKELMLMAYRKQQDAKVSKLLLCFLILLAKHAMPKLMLSLCLRPLT